MEKEFLRIKTILEGKKILFEIMEHEPVFTSEEASRVRGVPLEWGVKSMVLKGREFFLVLIRADKKVDFHLLKGLEGYKVRLAKPDEVLEKTNCEPGAVPPFGFSPLKTYLDRDVLEQEKVTFNAGLHTSSVMMKGKDLLKVLKDPLLF